MFTIEDIQTIVQRFYVKDDRVYARNIDQEIVDEKAVLPIKAAYLIFNEAEIRYKADLQLLGAKYVSSREKYLEKMMERFSVNGEINDLGQNKLIRDLIASNGHYEESISSDGLDSKFSIFIEPKKSYGLAYFRLKLQEVGFDTDDLTLSYDTTLLKDTGTARLFIDFKKRLYVEREELAMDDSSFEYKFAYDELEKAIMKEKTERIEYWSDFLKQWKRAKLSGDFERIEFLKGIVATIIKDIEKRQQKDKNDVVQNASTEPVRANQAEDAALKKPKVVPTTNSPVSNVVYLEPDIKSNATKIQEKEEESRFDASDVDYIIEQIAIARKADDKEALTRWNQRLNSISIVQEKKEQKIVEKPKILNSLLLRFDEVLAEIEQSKRSLKSPDALKMVYSDTRNAIKVCNIDETSAFWKGLSDVEREFAAQLMMKASALLDDRMRYNHWISIHEEILKVLGWPSDIKEMTPLLLFSNLKEVFQKVDGRILLENDRMAIKEYSEMCKSMWKKFNDEEKRCGAVLMKTAMKLLADERGYNYWTGVFDALSSKIGEN